LIIQDPQNIRGDPHLTRRLRIAGKAFLPGDKNSVPQISANASAAVRRMPPYAG